MASAYLDKRRLLELSIECCQSKNRGVVTHIALVDAEAKETVAKAKETLKQIDSFQRRLDSVLSRPSQKDAAFAIKLLKDYHEAVIHFNNFQIIYAEESGNSQLERSTDESTAIETAIANFQKYA